MSSCAHVVLLTEQTYIVIHCCYYNTPCRLRVDPPLNAPAWLTPSIVEAVHLQQPTALNVYSFKVDVQESAKVIKMV